MFVCHLASVSACANIANFSGHSAPVGAVRRLGAGECVGYLVQQNLVHLVVIVLFGKIARDGDAPRRVVAEAGSAFCVVERKCPRCGAVDRLKVQRNERLGPHSNSVKFSHDQTILGEVEG